MGRGVANELDRHYFVVVLCSKIWGKIMWGLKKVTLGHLINIKKKHLYTKYPTLYIQIFFLNGVTLHDQLSSLNARALKRIRKS